MKTLNTTLADAEEWADKRPPAIYLHTHRATLAAPGPVEIEPWQLPTITRQVADERAASQRFADSQANSAEGCADTSDDEGRSARIPEGGGLFIAVAIVVVLAAVFLLFHAAFRGGV